VYTRRVRNVLTQQFQAFFAGKMRQYRVGGALRNGDERKHGEKARILIGSVKSMKTVILINGSFSPPDQ
jgi:hypothetical protein